MKRRICVILAILLLNNVGTDVMASDNLNIIDKSLGIVVEDDINSNFVEVQLPSTRASYTLSGHSYYLDANYCAFSFTFLSKTTGKAVVTLQKKSGVSWINTGFYINASFENAWYFDGILAVRNLSSGVYRLKYSFSQPYSETIYPAETRL